MESISNEAKSQGAFSGETNKKQNSTSLFQTPNLKTAIEFSTIFESQNLGLGFKASLDVSTEGSDDRPFSFVVTAVCCKSSFVSVC
jgi:hypothetical protein